jgi:hypothetical protein
VHAIFGTHARGLSAIYEIGDFKGEILIYHTFFILSIIL